ncbi:MAG: 5,10-methylenetetrahydromethanopterin reductase [Candidatus Bathyarchaeia archaeon]
MVKFGIEFVPREVYWRTVYYTVESEKSGFNYVWITDHYNNRNVYVILTLIANYTNSIKLGTGVTNPYVCNPVFTATAIASLAEVAPNRVVCGIGAGDYVTLSTIGLKFEKPLAYVREAVEVIRTLTSGGTVDLDGQAFKIKGAKLNYKSPSKIPVYIGAQGPAMLKLAGEIGDGVLINASHPKDLKEAVARIREGVSKANRKIEDLDVAAYTSFSIAEEEAKAVEAAIPVVAFIVGGSPNIVLERHEIDLEKAQAIKDALVQGKFGRAFKNVTSEMVEAFSIAGTPKQCIDKIEQVLATGVTQFVVGSPIGPDVIKSIRMIGERIIPVF